MSGESALLLMGRERSEVKISTFASGLISLFKVSRFSETTPTHHLLLAKRVPWYNVETLLAAAELLSVPRQTTSFLKVVNSLLPDLIGAPFLQT